MWDFIINPFVTALTLFYAVTGNIVLSIVAFTVVTRMLLYPLTIQQQNSMKKQQALQPKIKVLQEKYKNDRDKLAQEQMKLFQEEGINPFGGCLLMFIQLPLFLGLYQAIIYALAATPLQLLDMSGRLLIPDLVTQIPLNNTWLGMDLTLPPTTNPVYALSLPVLVMVTTWMQSKLTMPAAPPKDTSKNAQPDPTADMTRSMTTIMPLMFGFFALSFSVGISIYFITSNLIGAFQYGVMGRTKPSATPVEENGVVNVEEGGDTNASQPSKKKKKATNKATS